MIRMDWINNGNYFMFVATIKINQLSKFKVSTGVSTLKNDWITGNFHVFPMTSDQRVEGSNPSGCTSF
jgi:hypothetical protein